MFKFFVFSLVFFCTICGIKAISFDPCLQLYENQQTFGGSAQSAVTTVGECWTRCKKTPGCKAFEWVPANPQDKCFFFFTSSGPPTFPDKPGVYHYSLKCACSWKAYTNMRMFGGVDKAHSTLAACQSACLLDTTCMAVEWVANSVGSKCFFFNTPDVPRYDQAGIDHYAWQCLPISTQIMTTSFSQNVLATSAPGCYWSFVDSAYTHGIVSQPTGKTLELCKQLCISSNRCQFGFDWNANADSSGRCSISTNRQLLASSTSRHYTYNCTNELNVWLVNLDTNTYNGLLVPSAYSLEECKDHCISVQGGCPYGLDWNTAAPLGQGCWMSTNAALNAAVVPGHVNHYYLAPSLVNNEGVDNLLDMSNCTWTLKANSNSPGGSMKPMYQSIEQCKLNCFKLSRSLCTGIDWDPNNAINCWFSSNNNLNTYPGVSHYSLSCPAGQTTSTSTSKAPSTTPAAIQCGYVKYDNSASDNGQLKSYTSDRDCRDQCTVQPLCRAYQWNGQCYFFNTSNKPTKPGNTPGSTYYVYVPCQ